MPTRNVSLTAEQDAFIQKVVQDGVYQNASEAVRDALRGLQQRMTTELFRLERLRTEIKIGIDALERGDYVDVEDHELEAFLERLSTDPDA